MEAHRLRHHHADPAHHLPLGDGEVRFRQAGPALRPSICTTSPSSSQDTPFRVFQSPYVGSVVYPGGGSLPRRQLDGWQDWAKQRGAKGLAYVLIGEDGELAGPVAKNLSDEEKADSPRRPGAQPGDAVFFAAGPTREAQALLGAARVEIAHRTGLIKDGDWAFVWVVDAPLFESAAEAQAAGDVAVGGGQWTAVHHAFTAPKPVFLDTLEVNPGAALAYAYDIVCNGNEIGGGSIRIHRRDVQERVFDVMGIGAEEAAGEVRLPPRSLQVRCAAARRHRLRLGPHRVPAGRGRLDP